MIIVDSQESVKAGSLLDRVFLVLIR